MDAEPAECRPKGLHVAVIMDGNGRWATRRGLPRVAGHRAGAAAARRIIEAALDTGIGCLTLYAFSSDNWRRPPAEVQRIFWLLRAFLRMETQRLRSRSVRLQVIGRRDRLATTVLREIEKAENATIFGTQMLLRIAIDYSSREAIARAAAILREQLGPQNQAQLAPQIAEAMLADGPDVDLLIRTGGEQRLSDFLLWESAYAELLFIDCMWPDFGADELASALDDFRHRERRFGGLPTIAAAVANEPGNLSR